MCSSNCKVFEISDSVKLPWVVGAALKQCFNSDKVEVDELYHKEPDPVLIKEALISAEEAGLMQKYLDKYIPTNFGASVAAASAEVKLPTALALVGNKVHKNDCPGVVKDSEKMLMLIKDALLKARSVVDLDEVTKKRILSLWYIARRYSYLASIYWPNSQRINATAVLTKYVDRYNGSQSLERVNEIIYTSCNHSIVPTIQDREEITTMVGLIEGIIEINKNQAIIYS